MKVLIVDDDPIARLIIKQNLKLSQQILSETLEAENGKIALDILNKNKVDTILLDLNMPVMNGFEVLSSLAEMNYKIPVFIITSSNLESDRTSCSHFEFVKGFFQKPITKETLNTLFS